MVILEGFLVENSSIFGGVGLILGRISALQVCLRGGSQLFWKKPKCVCPSGLAKALPAYNLLKERVI
jgi:hypothetical protein